MKRTFTFDGKRYWIRGDTEEECIRKIERKKMELELGVKKLSNICVDDWADEWMSVYRQDISLKNSKDTKRIIDNLISPEIGKMQVRNVKPIHLQKILNSTTNYSQAYCDKVFYAVTNLFRMAWKNGIINEDITKALVRPKGKPNRKRRALTPEERAALLKVAEYKYGGMFVKVMYYCGLRPGEVAGLDWDDIDFERRVINVNKAVKIDGQLGETKTSAGKRPVPIPSAFYGDLLNARSSGIVCPTTRGRRFTNSHEKKMWESIYAEMKKVGNVGDGLTLYCLRHDYCTRLQDAGVPINIAKDLMGHTNISTTAKIYTHRTDISLYTAAQLIDAHGGKSVASD